MQASARSGFKTMQMLEFYAELAENWLAMPRYKREENRQ
jgi:hypothetical protein